MNHEARSNGDGKENMVPRQEHNTGAGMNAAAHHQPGISTPPPGDCGSEDTSSSFGSSSGPKQKHMSSSKQTSPVNHNRGRKRTGSLRQTAMEQMRERTSSSRKEHSLNRSPTQTTAVGGPSLDPDSSRPKILEENAFFSASSSSLSSSDNKESLHDMKPATSQDRQRTIVAPIYGSTDEEESATNYRPSVSTSSFHNSDGGPVMSTFRRRSNRGELRTVPTSDEPSPNLDLETEWDYSETEWWGWVVLLVTWIVFVVGMGSCLGVWSWAWDVGETPYAPPELEDDATLPITGYYPALIVCTAVMSWVWVVVAWVGMKYFRHAKVVIEDG